MTVPGGHVSERQSNCGKFCIFKLQKIRKNRFWGEMAGIWDKPNCFVEQILHQRVSPVHRPVVLIFFIYRVILGR